jgi:hypothetical protein
MNAKKSANSIKLGTLPYVESLVRRAVIIILMKDKVQSENTKNRGPFA